MRNSKNNYFLLAYLLFLTTIGIAQDQPSYAITNIPPELIEDAKTITRINDISVKVNSPKSASATYHIVNTIINKKSPGYKFYLYYDQLSKLGKIKAKIYDAFGNLVREIKKSEIQDYSAVNGSLYSDNRYKYLNILHDSYPYTVEITYSKEYKNLMFFPSWSGLYYSHSIVSSNYQVEVPKELSIRYKPLNMDVEPQIENTDKKTIYKWSFENLAAVKSEPYSPAASKILPELLVTLDQFEVEKYNGSLSSWNDFGAFVYALNRDRDQLSPSMEAKVLELTKEAKSDAEKIDILYNYLKENMRYVSVQLGIGGWQTFDAKYVEENKYGDCKALTNFMKSMLKVAGITANNAYINSGRTPRQVYEDFPMAGFNHVILNVPSENCWLECTSKNAPTNYVGSSNRNRHVLLVTPTESKLIKTPKIGADQHFHKSTAEITLAASGQASVKHQLVLSGPKQEWWRYAMNNLSESEMKEKFQERSALNNFSIDQMVVDLNQKKPTATVKYALNIPRYASKAGKRIFVPINELSSFNNIPPANEERLHPISIQSDYEEEDHFTLVLPEGYEVESIPKKQINLDTPYGSYQVDITTEENQLKYQRKLMIKPIESPAEAYSEFRNFYKAVSKADQMKIVLVKKRT